MENNKESPTIEKAECEFCFEEVNAIDLKLMKVPLSSFNMWACDEFRKINKEN